MLRIILFALLSTSAYGATSVAPKAEKLATKTVASYQVIMENVSE